MGKNPETRKCGLKNKIIIIMLYGLNDCDCMQWIFNGIKTFIFYYYIIISLLFRLAYS